MSSSYERRKDQLEVFVVILVATGIVAAPALLLALALLRWMHGSERRRTVMLGATLGSGALLYILWESIALLVQDGLYALRDLDVDALIDTGGQLWVRTLVSTPIVALLVDAGRPRNPEQQELEHIRQREQARQRRRERAARIAATAPDHVNGQLVLGAPAEGDLHQCVVAGKYFVLPRDMLQRHLVAVGGSGLGKTETILRIAKLAATVYGWTVIYLDAKGDEKTARRFAGIMRAAGIKRVAIFPDAHYDGWRGTATELFNRLMEIEDYSEPYYKNIAKLMLSLALSAPGGPPRNSHDFVQRLRKSTLKQLYGGLPEAEEIASIADTDAAGVYNRYRAFFAALGGQLDGAWAFEDVDACYICLNGTALKDEAASLGRYLMEDFTQFAAIRKHPEQHVLFIVDEFSALSKADTDVDNQFERLRSFNAHIIVSAQGYAGLGKNAERMLDAAAGIILHGCDNPEDLIARAGTIKLIERSVQKDTLGATGLGSLRAQDAYRVNPNDAGQLGKGECFVISGRRAHWVKVRKLEDTAPVRTVDAVAFQEQFAERRRSRQRAASPAPVGQQGLDP